MKVTVIESDITTLPVDAIVNAANSSLLGGGGVDGAIHSAAGPELLAACRLLHGCRTGEAKATPGFNLPAQRVFHTVGPVWSGGQDDEDALLASCYSQCLGLATQHHCRGIAFPSISTGVYGFPKPRAAGIAVATVQSWATESNDSVDEVIFCCFSAADVSLYRNLGIQSG